MLAAEQLTRFGRYGSATYAQIFSLFYIRLTALTLINTTPLAAQEVKALEDFSSSYYPRPNNQHAPCAVGVAGSGVSLQGRGFGDWRRGLWGITS